ncbi:MAG: PIN domain-containing protein [Bacteroidales bacterium]|nr:PIN domain-containing protein [Bacteroidales bacterium]
MQYLLDTNICVFLLRGKYDVNKAIARVGSNNCHISELTAMELKYGAELLFQRDGIDQRDQLNEMLNSVDVLPIDNAIDMAASEKARLRLKGTPIDDDFDLLIGCTAVANDMTMVTENTKDFKNLTGIKLENWITR